MGGADSFIKWLNLLMASKTWIYVEYISGINHDILDIVGEKCYKHLQNGPTSGSNLHICPTLCHD